MSSKKTQQARLDQGFMEMVNPVKTFKILELDVHARALLISEIGELKTLFPEWQTANMADLFNADNQFEMLKVFSEVIWLGVREHTPDLASKPAVQYAVNLRTLSHWMEVVEWIADVEFNENSEESDLSTGSETSEASEGNS